MNMVVTFMMLFYITVTTIITVVRGKRKVTDAEDFFIASKNLGAFEIFSLIYASSLGIGSTVAAAELGFIKGISASWWEIAGDVIIILASFGLVKYLRMFVRFSIFEILELKFNVITRIISASIMSIGFFTSSIAQLIGCSVILGSGVGIPMEWAVLLTTTIVLAILIVGGMRGIGYANIIHTTVSMVGTFILLGFCLWQLGGVEGMIMKLPSSHLNLGRLGVSETLAWILSQSLRFVISATIIQVILSAKDTKTAIIGTTGGAIGMLFVGVSSVLIGMSSRALWPSISPMLAESYAAMQMHPIAAGLVLGGIFSSLTGTIAGYWLTTSTILIFDVYERIIHRNVLTIRSLTVARVILILMAVAAMVLALYPQPYMLHVHITGISTISIVSIIVLFALLRRFNALAGLAGLTGGLGSMIVWMALNEPFQINKIYISTLSTLLFFLAAHHVFTLLGGGLYYNIGLAVRDLLAGDHDLRMALINDVLEQIQIARTRGFLKTFD